MATTTNHKEDGAPEIWVLAERHGERWDSVILEQLQDAQSLAKRAGWHVTAVVFTKPNVVQDKDCQELAAHGAAEVVLLENETFCQPNGPLTYSETLKRMMEQRALQVLLCPSSPLWVECATALMTSINGFIVSNVMSFRLARDKMEVTRYGWQNKVQLTLSLPVDQPCVLAMRPNVAGVGRTKPGQKAKIVRIQAEQKASDKVQLQELLPPDPRELDLGEAEHIVAGGRGVGGPEGFELLEKLAVLLEAGVGATRVAVDLGWVPYSRQIGQTGKTVKPRLYVAVGISGAAQHVDGMRESEVIIAVNKDPKAGIFQLADLSVVGDAQKTIEALLQMLSTRLKSGSEVAAASDNATGHSLG